jgi:hypothetical protein
MQLYAVVLAFSNFFFSFLFSFLKYFLHLFLVFLGFRDVSGHLIICAAVASIRCDSFACNRMIDLFFKQNERLKNCHII